MFQFTFDKDGKVFDATLPMVSGFERKVSSGKYLYFVMQSNELNLWNSTKSL